MRLVFPSLISAIILVTVTASAGTNDTRPSLEDLVSRAESTAQQMDSFSAAYALSLFSTEQKLASEGEMYYLAPLHFKVTAKTVFGQMNFNQSTIYDGDFIWQLTETPAGKKATGTPVGKQVFKIRMNRQSMLSRMQRRFEMNDMLEPCRLQRLFVFLSQQYDLAYKEKVKVGDDEGYAFSGRLKNIPPERQTVSGIPLPLMTSIRIVVRQSDALPLKLEAFDANDILILDYTVKTFSANIGLKEDFFLYKPSPDAKVIEINGK
ncbi:MAG: hypothetical protein PHT33_00885 [bacterium]|nr:hypothetical protein [bacterium]